MHLGTAIPWWGLALWAAAIAALATFAYRRVGALSGRQRLILTTLRAFALAFVSLCLLRPMVRATPADRVGGTVAILIDQSRSMALRDAGGLSRLERAGAISRQLQPSLAARWKVETWLFGDGLHDAHDVAMSPTANRSDLATDLSAAVARLAPPRALRPGRADRRRAHGHGGPRRAGPPAWRAGGGDRHRSRGCGRHRHPQRGGRGVEPRCQPRGSRRRH